MTALKTIGRGRVAAEDFSSGQGEPTVAQGACCPARPTLSAAGRQLVRSQWASELGVPADAFAAPGTRFVARENATAVVVVELDGSCVALGPPAVAERLEGLDRGALLDVPTLARTLHGLGPRPIGAATLSYRDAHVSDDRSSAGERRDVGTAPADDAEVDLLRRTLPADEWDESGLASMPRRWSALTAAGDVAAVAGYERWGDDIAQLGVATDPTHRGRGHAAAVAARVVAAALDDGLVVQWRCRLGNGASERLATRLGFTRVGRQTAVLVGEG